MASSVKLGDRLESYVDKLVEKGRYGSRSEVLREGVRLVHEREAWLEMVQAQVNEGLADVDAGRVISLDQAADDLADRYRQWPR
ncbi:antitoxin ParD1/3/4 [Sphingomonas endophytica]|jgi:antitoxin ParD1/3/4|uniref:Antitoxin ParD1/3/4 n=1 Tax=Sphingomonas endophytica TaxID=869719 RepID=A0A7X0JES8_9SPHN|nr:type II toxin-antitoxin system ParD family antitoxin [Sphingomonas endophytica]MBB6505950.1 antitoxin ParD1/3/4 [Sphingomonas endophytica]